MTGYNLNTKGQSIPPQEAMSLTSRHDFSLADFERAYETRVGLNRLIQEEMRKGALPKFILVGLDATAPESLVELFLKYDFQFDASLVLDYPNSTEEPIEIGHFMITREKEIKAFPSNTPTVILEQKGRPVSIGSLSEQGLKTAFSNEIRKEDKDEALPNIVTLTQEELVEKYNISLAFEDVVNEYIKQGYEILITTQDWSAIPKESPLRTKISNENTQNLIQVSLINKGKKALIVLGELSIDADNIDGIRLSQAQLFLQDESFYEKEKPQKTFTAKRGEDTLEVKTPPQRLK